MLDVREIGVGSFEDEEDGMAISLNLASSCGERLDVKNGN